MSVRKSKKACILSHALHRVGPLTFYAHALQTAWYLVKTATTDDQAYLLTYLRLYAQNRVNDARFLYHHSIQSGKGDEFRRVIRLLELT